MLPSRSCWLILPGQTTLLRCCSSCYCLALLRSLLRLLPLMPLLLLWLLLALWLLLGLLRPLWLLHGPSFWC